MRYRHLIILALTLLCLVGCENGKKNTSVSNDKDSSIVNDTLTADTAEYVGGGNKSLNDIRFANFSEKDWLDNEYIRCLRRYLDDYNSGKIENDVLDQNKEKIKGNFVIAWAEPYLMGGLFIRFIFVDYPDDMFLAWVYSFVDEEAETVLDYEVRSIYLDEEKSGFTKDEIFETMKEHPELKLW
ncbi:MAG: hypothetical protein J6W52_05130 [Bacteroidaceae bacterium]|nr:hypothetical protein [Bacteroidaceae bacterium]